MHLKFDNPLFTRVFFVGLFLAVGVYLDRAVDLPIWTLGPDARPVLAAGRVAVEPTSGAWQPHPEVWLLVGGLVGLYVYAARVIGPKVVPAGHAAGHPRARGAAFVAGDRCCCGWRPTGRCTTSASSTCTSST